MKAADTSDTPTRTGGGFWPTSVRGKLGVALFLVSLVLFVPVNAVAGAILHWVLVGASLALTATARVRDRDRSISVLVALIFNAIGLVFSVLFLAGEVFIGHD